jgi:hypothetical protein
MNDEPDAAELVNVALEENKSAFHWARQKAQKKEREITVPVDETPAAPVGWRARALMREDRTRSADLGSESAFPTLGGNKATTKSPPKQAGGSIWSQFQTDDTDDEEVHVFVLFCFALPPSRAFLFLAWQDEVESSETPDATADTPANTSGGGEELVKVGEKSSSEGTAKEGGADAEEDANRFAGLKKKKKKKPFESSEAS